MVFFLTVFVRTDKKEKILKYISICGVDFDVILRIREGLKKISC